MSLFSRIAEIFSKTSVPASDTQPRVGGRGPASPGPIDQMRALLADLALDEGDREAIAEFDALVQDPSKEPELLEEWNGPPTQEDIEYRAFRHVCAERWLVSPIDWADGYEEVIELIEVQLGELDADERQAVIDFAESLDLKRGDSVGAVYGPLAAIAERLNLKIIDLNEGSDCYQFAVLPPEIARKWIGVQVGKAFKVEDPGWQFVDVLKGTPYEKYTS